MCARRAAGWAIAMRFAPEQSDADERPRSALSQLRWLENLDSVDPAVRAAAGRLTEQINEDHELPHTEDPLEDAKFIVDALQV